MSKKKYFAIREGFETGIFYDEWDNVKHLTNGYPSAKFKGFWTEKEALDYLGAYEKYKSFLPETIEGDTFYQGVNIPTLSEPLAFGEEIVYVDGSFNPKNNKAGYAYLRFFNGLEHSFNKGYVNTPDKEKIYTRNVMGEIHSVLNALSEIKHQHKTKKHHTHLIEIRYDYEGIACWIDGSWEAKDKVTQRYQYQFELLKEYFDKHNIKIKFLKVAAHSKEKGNEFVDKLAKLGCGVQL